MPSASKCGREIERGGGGTVGEIVRINKLNRLGAAASVEMTREKLHGAGYYSRKPRACWLESGAKHRGAARIVVSVAI